LHIIINIPINLIQLISRNGYLTSLCTLLQVVRMTMTCFLTTLLENHIPQWDLRHDCKYFRKSRMHIIYRQCYIKFPYSPWLRSKTMSLSRTEVILCAMVITVQSEKCCLSVCWIRLSVAVSTEAVASSRTKTLLFLSSTRPRQTSCLWPILQFSPFSITAPPSRMTI